MHVADQLTRWRNERNRNHPVIDYLFRYRRSRHDLVYTHLRAYLTGTRESYYILYPMANGVQDVANWPGNPSTRTTQSNDIGTLRHSKTVFLREQPRMGKYFAGT